MPTPPTVPVVCAVLVRNGKVLLAQRPEGKKEAGLWEFPGGKVEAGEDPAKALQRELAEELGCQVTVVGCGPVAVYQYPWGAIELRAFLCHLLPNSPEPEAHEHADLAWVGLNELEDRPLAPADVPLLPWIKQCLAGGTPQ